MRTPDRFGPRWAYGPRRSPRNRIDPLADSADCRAFEVIRHKPTGSGPCYRAPWQSSASPGNGRPSPQQEFICSSRCSSRSSLPMYSRITAPSRPTVDTKSPRAQKCCALSPDISHRLRHCVLRRYRDHHVHVVRHQMPFFDPALLHSQPPASFFGTSEMNTT